MTKSDEVLMYLTNNLQDGTPCYFIPSDTPEAIAFAIANKLPLWSTDWPAICAAAADVCEVNFDDDHPSYHT